jgi:hypothetical protein
VSHHRPKGVARKDSEGISYLRVIMGSAGFLQSINFPEI